MKRILFIDDNEELIGEIVQNFDNSVEFIKCINTAEALEKIEDNIPFDFVILDWFLEHPEDSVMSKLVLAKMKAKHFRPVFIYSEHITDFEDACAKGEVNFPTHLIKGLSKQEFNDAETLRNELQKILDASLTTQISGIYRETIAKSLESVFFDLAELPEGEIASVIKVLVGESGNIDWSNDFILNLIHRKLLGNTAFVEKLETMINAAKDIDTEKTPELRRKLINRALYFSYNATTIKCGDIVSINISDESPKTAIIITPDCDLEWGKTRFLELIELRQMNDESLKIDFNNQKRIEDIISQREESYYFFPAVPLGDSETDMVAVFKSKIILEELPEKAHTKIYPKASCKLGYSAKFLYRGKEVSLSFICSKSNPYKSDFLHSLHSHNSRVGTPDIKKLIL
jgi:CheY-like chemotaxis protein